MEENKDVLLSIGEKYMLTIKEAGAYFNIGIKKCADLLRIISEFSRFTAVTGI